MRRARRGFTLIELLIAVSILSLLAALMSPVLLTAYREAMRVRCAKNMGQLYTALDLVNAGKLPQCFALVPGTDQVDEASWWYRVAADVLYPQGNGFSQLTVPRADDPWWAANPNANVQPFPPDSFCLRCPASRDYYDDRFAPSTVPKTYEIDKDRVYDDNYGYNALGFRYSPDVRTIHLPDGPNAVETSYLYHQPNAAGVGGRVPMEAVRGQFADTPSTTSIGSASQIADMAGTILLMDYIKADAQPFPGVDDLYGYRFRHRERANVLLADGHVEVHSKAHFLRRVGGPGLHWEVRRAR